MSNISNKQRRPGGDMTRNCGKIWQPDIVDVEISTEPRPRQIKMVHQRLEEDHSRQMEQAQRQAKADAERVQMRSEAEIADFRATISRLEVDLVKVNSQYVSFVTMRTDSVLTGKQSQDPGTTGTPGNVGRAARGANTRSPGSAWATQSLRVQLVGRGHETQRGQ